MRRVALALLLSSVLYALPVGNPAEASLYKEGAFFDPCAVTPCSPLFMFVGGIDFRLGYWGDASWDCRAKESLMGSSLGSVSKIRLRTSAGYSALNIYNWMDVFATFGVSSIQVKRTTELTDSQHFLVFSPTFSWSVGGRATLYRNGPFYLGGMGQYFRCQPRLRSMFDYYTGTVLGFSNSHARAFEEWQVAAGGALNLGNSAGTSFIPYAAIKINQGRFGLEAVQFTAYSVPYELPHLRFSNYFGWALGCTWLEQEAIGVTVEGRWLNEKGVFVNGQLRF